MSHQAEESLSQEIASFLQTPSGNAPWEDSWQAARLLFLLHPYLDGSALHSNQQEALHQRLDGHRRALEQMPPERWLQAAQATFTALQKSFGQVVGDPTQPTDLSLELLLCLQKELDALQWLLSSVREEEEFAIAEAFADLSLVEREVSQLKRAHKRSTKSTPIPPQLEQLDTRLQSLREELLAREGSYFLQSTEAIVPASSIDPTLSLAASSATRVRSRRLSSRPQRTRREVQPPTQQAAPSAPTSPSTPVSPPAPTSPSASTSIADYERCQLFWEALLQAEVLILATRLEALSASRVSHITGYKEALSLRHQQLKEQLQQELAKLSNDERRSWYVQNLPRMTDEIDENLATLDDIDMSEAIVHLKHMESQMAWLHSMVSPLQEGRSPGHQEFANTAKQIHRLQHRLRAESQEKKLQAKLEDKFGHRAVAFSENLILFLIFLVIVFLTIEYALKLSPAMKLALMWADTLVCVVFLTEFFVKMYYAEGKALYLRRHFLLDLLPSIPFSLIFWLVQGPALTHVAAARAARLARLSRLARYIRILRPLIRIFRVVTFMMRALDRMVRKYETVFNRNVILFPSPQELQRTAIVTPETKIQQLRHRCRKRMRMLLSKLPPDEHMDFLLQRTDAVENQLGGHNGESRQQGILQKSAEAVYFDQLIETMMAIDEIEAEEVLGEGFIRQTAKIFRFFAFPGVRILPGIRRLARAQQQLSSAALVAWLIQGIGRQLERIQRVFHWCGDLYGIVTGPQVLDRIGLTLINATLRPAKRLLIFGLLFLVVTLFVQAFSIGWLHDAARFLTKFLGAPIIILGLVSLLPLLLGFWFRLIAGETTDFFSRISEAQFIARLKQIKQHKSTHDLHHIVRRVLQPEALLRKTTLQQPERLVQQLQRQLDRNNDLGLQELATSRPALPRLSTAATATEPQGHPRDLQTDWSERDRVLLLYEDYLDGTPLHRSDTKTTNHLLGNITIQNIRKHRLGLNLVQNLRIEKLDLSRPRLLLYFGPYLWFASITESLTHRLARLIVEYNQNCIPHDELEWLGQDERDAYEQWLQKREKRLAGIPLPPERQKKDEREFRTTAFTALHFLSAEPERDGAVARLFGERLVLLMQTERRLLTRELFGYFPFHTLPKDKRTFNLYQSYQNNIARGRFFLLPFKMVWWFGKSLVWGIMRIHQLVKDVLQPPSQVETEVHGKAGFNVAIRKINRMRKPIYTECMRLRAAFDLEYLGFFLPGYACSGLEGSDYLADLDYINASARERHEFVALRQEREEQLLVFDAFLEEKGWKGEALPHSLARIHPQLVAKEGQILRALTAAFAADYRQVRSLLLAHKALQDFFAKADTTTPSPSRWTRWKEWCFRAGKTIFFLLPDKEKLRWQACWEAAPRTHTMEQDWQRYLQQRETLQAHCKLLAESQLDPIAEAHSILSEVIQHSSIWTEEILTLRTLQTLTQLDIQLYRELVHTIGQYEEKI